MSNLFNDYKKNLGTVTDSFGAQSQIYQGNNWLNKKDIFGTGAGSNLGSIAGVVNQGVDTTLNLVGKHADDISGGEQVYSKLTDGALNMAVKTGNPLLMAGAGVLKGLDYLNRYAGKTTDKQGTIGIDTGAYTNLINSKANRKQTLLFSGKNRMNRLNYLTKSYDKQNILAADANYGHQINNLAAANSMQDVLSRNQQSLMGGINTNILAAKKGAKINPAQLRNLVKKAKRGAKITETITLDVIFEQGSDYDIDKLQDGGKLNVIPEGALHARKHSLPEEIAEKVTNKGIPVITLEEGGDIKQHAEIEVNEIIFNKETTDKLEDFFKKFNETEDIKEKDLIAVEAGKFLASEILENTEDNTGLIETIE